MKSMKKWLQFLGQRCLPQRYLLTFMSFLGVVITLSLRVNLSVAITKMIKYPTGHNNSCKQNIRINTDMHVCQGGDLEWDEATQGYVQSFFYLGYLLAHLPGAYISRKIGGKYTLGVSVLGSSLLSILSVPAACTSAAALTATRFAMGIVEGPMFPALSDLLSEWAPPSERTLLSSTIFAGVQIGSVVSMAITGYILSSMAWSVAFYIFGVIGVFWFVFWMFLCYNKPSVHPFISSSELEYITKSISPVDKRTATPWKAMLKSKPLWALVIAEMGHDYALYTTITELPTFYCEVTTDISISKIGVMSGLPYLIMWVASVIMGYVCDKLIELKDTPTARTNLRRLLGVVGSVIPGIGMVWASYVTTNKEALFSLVPLSVAFMACCYSSIRVNPLDLSPNHAATIMAIANGAGAISGFIAPICVGAMIKHHTVEEWQHVFWMVFAILLATCIPFAICGSGDVQPWNQPQEEEPAVSTVRRRSTLSGGEPIREKYKNYYPEQSAVPEE